MKDLSASYRPKVMACEFRTTPHVLHDATCKSIERTRAQLKRLTDQSVLEQAVLTALFESGNCLSSTDLITEVRAWIRPHEADDKQITTAALGLKGKGLMNLKGVLHHVRKNRWSVSDKGTHHLDTPNP